MSLIYTGYKIVLTHDTDIKRNNLSLVQQPTIPPPPHPAFIRAPPLGATLGSPWRKLQVYINVMLTHFRCHLHKTDHQRNPDVGVQTLGEKHRSMEI